MLHFRSLLFTISLLFGSFSVSANADTPSVPDKGSEEVVELFFSAAKIGNVDVLQEFLKHGFPIDVQDHSGYSALMMASYYGQKEAVNILIQQGANRCLRDKRGHTALMGAIVKAEWGIAKQLRQVDCDLNAEKTGQLTAEQFAIQFGQQQRLKQIQAELSN
ncbi:ankyrin repeat domain-containing protein [Acinetobacter genomosp. 15BJ]|uniref:Ankyrin repeat domain-containing protein n=1 Tax=Acinetobacter genomosp. 15BJ TaxID=106651 RepID=A0ABT8V1E0_9GAMM|nr:ankyrin repeat domain-containing protein [Acinetobacter genomosp. 15BJ]MCH7292712.1 ankyrin repeat domain-containing protein [Acinetobacter genomosp. 15BJ]MDO3657455.1 ankyrin repeat domain-containing protein [Acinetobacter genomosp. 15BJ]